jgi:hypothetical protein
MCFPGAFPYTGTSATNPQMVKKTLIRKHTLMYRMSMYPSNPTIRRKSSSSTSMTVNTQANGNVPGGGGTRLQRWNRFVTRFRYVLLMCRLTSKNVIKKAKRIKLIHSVLSKPCVSLMLDKLSSL